MFYGVNSKHGLGIMQHPTQVQMSLQLWEPITLILIPAHSPLGTVSSRPNPNSPLQPTSGLISNSSEVDNRSLAIY